jgi:hypothetical protein
MSQRSFWLHGVSPQQPPSHNLFVEMALRWLLRSSVDRTPQLLVWRAKIRITMLRDAAQRRRPLRAGTEAANARTTLTGCVLTTNWLPSARRLFGPCCARGRCLAARLRDILGACWALTGRRWVGLSQIFSLRSNGAGEADAEGRVIDFRSLGRAAYPQDASPPTTSLAQLLCSNDACAGYCARLATGRLSSSCSVLVAHPVTLPSTGVLFVPAP